MSASLARAPSSGAHFGALRCGPRGPARLGSARARTWRADLAGSGQSEATDAAGRIGARSIIAPAAGRRVCRPSSPPANIICGQPLH